MKIDLKREDLKKKLIAAIAAGENLETNLLLGEALAVLQAQADIIANYAGVMERVKPTLESLIAKQPISLLQRLFAYPQTSVRARAANVLANIVHTESKNAAK